MPSSLCGGAELLVHVVGVPPGGLMRTIKEPVLAAWMNDHVDEKMRATVFSTSGQLDSFGQIIGGPIVGLVAQQVSIP